MVGPRDMLAACEAVGRLRLASEECVMRPQEASSS